MLDSLRQDVAYAARGLRWRSHRSGRREEIAPRPNRSFGQQAPYPCSDSSFVVNLVWLIVMLSRKRWHETGIYWYVWTASVVAVGIDFAHH